MVTLLSIRQGQNESLAVWVPIQDTPSMEVIKKCITHLPAVVNRLKEDMAVSSDADWTGGWGAQGCLQLSVLMK